MKSVRFRKLMKGIKVSQQQPSTHYEVTVSPGVNCECFIEYWNEEKLKSLGQFQSSKGLLQHFSDSFEIPEEMLGKKSSEIIISRNELYCLKLINQEDLQTFSNIFQTYFQLKKHNKKSLLIPVFRVVILHTIHQNKNKWIDSFLIMPNLKTKSTILFDIKGHCDSRFVPVADFKDFGFGKDQNFIKSSHKKKLQNLSSETKMEIHQRIKADLEFLKKCKVIDYSLILIFKNSKPQPGQDKITWYALDENSYVSLVIIDYLQQFNQRKRLQNKFKSLFHKQISSVDPETYAKRLLQFVQKHVLIQFLAK